MEVLLESARHSNKFFKEKRTLVDLMFNKSEESTETFTSKSLKNMFKALNLMEVEWTLEQRELSKKRVVESMEKSKRVNESVDVLLKKVKRAWWTLHNSKRI